MEAAAIQTGDIESPLSFGAGSSCQHVWFRNTKLISSSNGTVVCVDNIFFFGQVILILKIGFTLLKS